MARIVDFKTRTIKSDQPVNRRIDGDLIAPAEAEARELAVDRTSEPIKSLHDINRISTYLVEQGRYRDNMLFIVGINFGLRIGDLLELRFQDLINNNRAGEGFLEFKDSLAILEQKTKNTRKRRKNRYIAINDSVVWAVVLYLEHTPGVSLSDYMFRSASNNGKFSDNHLSRQSVDAMLKGLGKELGLDIKISTHTLRKTFAFHQMLMSHNDPRKLLLLQKILGHSSVGQTLDYIGITKDEIEAAYMELNLGGEQCVVGEMYEAAEL